MNRRNFIYKSSLATTLISFGGILNLVPEVKSLTEKWKPTGFLDWLSESQCEEMASILDSIARWLVTNCPPEGTKEYMELDRFAGIVLPSARKVYEKMYPKKFPNARCFMYDCLRFTTRRKMLYDELVEASYIALDGESEFVNYYCEDFLKRADRLEKYVI